MARTPLQVFTWMITYYFMLTRRAGAFVPTRIKVVPRPYFLTTDASSTGESSESPWTDPALAEKRRHRKRNNNSRFRQHVNPLARKYQQKTALTQEWPTDVFDQCDKKLHLDIGCSKGGFLIDMAKQESDFNYLGLEIRPMVAQYAKDRIGSHKLQGRLDFLGCNANIDLERILERYQQAGEGKLDRVTIQYPDPHFKTQHAKRRVVTSELVDVLARFMPADAIIFLQSDIQSVLDDMRKQFGKCRYFVDSSPNEYMAENVLGVPTEREVSVLDKGLPVYRVVFTRTDEAYC